MVNIPNYAGGNIEVLARELAPLIVKYITSDKVSVSSNDTTPDYLLNKLAAGTNITLTETNDGSNETVTIASSGGGAGTYSQWLSADDFVAKGSPSAYDPPTKVTLASLGVDLDNVNAWQLAPSGAGSTTNSAVELVFGWPFDVGTSNVDIHFYFTCSGSAGGNFELGFYVRTMQDGNNLDDGFAGSRQTVAMPTSPELRIVSNTGFNLSGAGRLVSVIVTRHFTDADDTSSDSALFLGMLLKSDDVT